MKKKMLVLCSILLVITVIIAGNADASTNGLIRNTPVNSDKLVIDGQSTAARSNLEYWDTEDEIPAGEGPDYDLFLKLDGIQGSSVDDKHKNEIDVLSYSFGGRNENGATQYKVFRVLKNMDASSPKLFQAMIDGLHIKEAKLEIRKAGSRPETVARITLRDVTVISYKQYGASEFGATEEILLGYASIEYSFFNNKSDGSSTEIKALGRLK